MMKGLKVTLDVITFMAVPWEITHYSGRMVFIPAGDPDVTRILTAADRELIDHLFNSEHE